MEIIQAGGYLWTVDSADWMYKIDPSTFTVSDTLELSIAVSDADGSLCADATYIYVGGWGDIAKVQISDCTETAYNTIEANESFHAIAQYGDYIYAFNQLDKKLQKIAKLDLSLNSSSSAVSYVCADDMAIDGTYAYLSRESATSGIERFTLSDLTVSSLATGIGMGKSYGCFKVNDGTNDRLLVLDADNNYIWILSMPACSLVRYNNLQGLETSDSINELTSDGTYVYLSQWVTSGNTPLSRFVLNNNFWGSGIGPFPTHFRI